EETAKEPEYSASEPVEQSTNAAPEEEPAKEELKWYQKLEVIDGDQAVKNSGSEDAFAAILKIFVDSVDNKAAELDEYFEDGDWVDYTIKVHALKSSARLIGAEAVAEEAQLLETAGKEGNTGYIRQKHESFMMAYRQLGDHLKKALGGAEEEKAAEAADEKQKPVADSNLMQSVYEDLKSAAEAMDCDTIGEIIKELDDYSIPEEDREKFEAIREKAGKFDYDGILAVLDNK
ncbi:MAG: Hpt domain-containing protein, partial [Lachnospiraceae bacterium]|nr:Hpt domain-containing protein [Lachnospiraceae bacterium]